MRKLLAFSLVALLLASHAAPSGASRAAVRANVSPDEYDVYSALIKAEYIKEDTRLVVLAGPTYSPAPAGASAVEFFPEWREDLLALSAETRDDFVARNSDGPQIVGRSLSLDVDYIIVDYAAIQGLFEEAVLEDAWKEFYEKYPRSNGYMRVSRVGFNRAKDRALVHMSWMCDQRCGEGKYVLLVRRDGEWKVEGKSLQWVS